MCGAATGDKGNSNKARWVRDLDKSPRITPLYEIFLFKPSSALQGFPVQLFSSGKTTVSQEKKKENLFIPLHDVALTYQLMKIKASSFMRFWKLLMQQLTFRWHPQKLPFLFISHFCYEFFFSPHHFQAPCKGNSIGHPRTLSNSFLWTKQGDTSKRSAACFKCTCFEVRRWQSCR